MEFSNGVSNFTFQVLVGIFIAIIVFFTKNIYSYVVSRNVRRFWKPFINQEFTIIITEYPITGNGRLSNIAKSVETGWLTSKGTALALANLQNFCENNITLQEKIFICGDKTGTLETANIIVLGSPANNLYAKSMFEHINNIYDIPYRVIWNEDGVPIEILTNEGNKLSPIVENGSGSDYALVIKARYQNIPSKSVLLISGCYMWGTKAAAEAVTLSTILNLVARETNNAENVAFIVKTQIMDNNALTPELDIDKKIHIRSLESRVR